jgi:hypothetical protein
MKRTDMLFGHAVCTLFVKNNFRCSNYWVTRIKTQEVFVWSGHYVCPVRTNYNVPMNFNGICKNGKNIPSRTNPEYTHFQFLAPFFTAMSYTVVLYAVWTAEVVRLSQPGIHRKNLHRFWSPVIHLHIALRRHIKWHIHLLTKAYFTGCVCEGFTIRQGSLKME